VFSLPSHPILLPLDGGGYEDLRACSLVEVGEGGVPRTIVPRPPPLQELLGNELPSQLFPLPQGERS
jgi:hypothetical protein